MTNVGARIYCKTGNIAECSKVVKNRMCWKVGHCLELPDIGREKDSCRAKHYLDYRVRIASGTVVGITALQFFSQ